MKFRLRGGVEEMNAAGEGMRLGVGDFEMERYGGVGVGEGGEEEEEEGFHVLFYRLRLPLWLKE